MAYISSSRLYRVNDRFADSKSSLVAGNQKLDHGNYVTRRSIPSGSIELIRVSEDVIYTYDGRRIIFYNNDVYYGHCEMDIIDISLTEHVSNYSRFKLCDAVVLTKRGRLYFDNISTLTWQRVNVTRLKCIFAAKDHILAVTHQGKAIMIRNLEDVSKVPIPATLIGVSEDLFWSDNQVFSASGVLMLERSQGDISKCMLYLGYVFMLTVGGVLINYHICGDKITFSEMTGVARISNSGRDIICLTNDRKLYRVTPRLELVAENVDMMS